MPVSPARSRRLARATGIGLLPLGLAMMAQGAGVLGASSSPERGAVAAPAAQAPSSASASAATAISGDGSGERRGKRAVADRDIGTQREALLSAAEPTGVTIPALGVKSSVEPIEVTPDGVLDPPSDVSRVGWWQRSAPIAASGGQTVLTGHSVHGGGGVFDDLDALARGDVIKTFSDGAMARYRVRDVLVWSRDELAQRAEEVFAQDRQDGRLVLVTCEDWNGAVWESNVVVLARRVLSTGSA